MAFKFINPGYSGLFTLFKDGNGYIDAGTIESYIYNPRCGVACYGYDFRTDIRVQTNKLWIKFDVYLPETTTSKTGFNFEIASKRTFELTQNGTDLSITLLNDSAFKLTNRNTALKLGTVNTIWLYVQTGNGWTISLVVNGNLLIDEYSSSNYTIETIPRYSMIGFNKVPQEMPLSNFILSDEEIDLKETIMPVGYSEVETNMAENNGVYSTVEDGAYVLQKLDSSNLNSVFGSTGKVTAMVAIAAPAYSTDSSNIYTLRCRKVESEFVGTDTVETTTDYYLDETMYDYGDNYLPIINDSELNDADDEEELDDSENQIPAVHTRLQITSDTSIASLNNLKIGFVAVGG